MSFEQMQSTKRFILEQQTKYLLQRQEYEERFLPVFQQALATLDKLARKAAARKSNRGGNSNDEQTKT